VSAFRTGGARAKRPWRSSRVRRVSVWKIAWPSWGRPLSPARRRPTSSRAPKTWYISPYPLRPSQL